ncbi:3-dehydroquinate synthase [Chengkuizengella axinellae]|uniref:3-dehydroquinate synthase n=1 Tax=Chengkuizengella axinellae TaxID=3064388 RepID=A0ABT9IWQ7_9BACL|nr:3-dehydroquinate synthase [Chengkuizengella sp. 2205SS18-9]MDP5273806.1 3-dehydroquinate synthase [Chengkuizengella sp. 2205SS18-9]
MKQLNVDLGDRSYPIYIGDGIIEQIGSYFAKHQISSRSPIMVITDDNVASLHLKKVTTHLLESGYKVVEYIVPAGEMSKSLSVLEQIIGKALDAGLDRTSTIIALGGGVVGDLAGFVAASFMRGVKFVQIPTTILAHDSSVGGKVAVNHPKAKNIIGAFHQPQIVLYDTSTLKTLPEREIKAGLSEMIKHGLIWDAEFSKWIDENAEKLLSLDAEALEYGLYNGCKIKSHVVSEDEREHGLRAILNFGHTIGHALEAVAHYNQLLHGEAIAIGMVGAAKLSVRLGYPERIYTETKAAMKKYGLPIQIPGHLDIDEIMKAMLHDKKFKEGKVVFTILKDIGEAHIQSGISIDLIREIVEELRWEE